MRFSRCFFIAISIFLAGIMVSCLSSAKAQNADNSKLPPFEVVSVRQNISGSSGFPAWYVTDGLNLEDVPLSRIIQAAYGYWHTSNFTEDRVIGLPGWTQSARYDIKAKVAEHDIERWSKLTNDQRSPALRGILMDRFGLKTHVEKRVKQVYVLVEAKKGSKLREATPGYEYPDKLGGGGLGGNRFRDDKGHLTAQGIKLASLADHLATILHKTVVDGTGLTASYDFKLNYAPDNNSNELATSGSAQQSTDPSIFTALEEQLGLKLELKKEPIDYLVVDQVSQLSAN